MEHNRKRRMTKAQREWRPGTPKKRRSIKVTFASVVLTLEALVVLFATLAAFGLLRDTIPPALILAVGVVLALALVGACAFLTKPYGIAIGWALQLLIIATGFIEPTMFLIGVLFALTWLYGIRTGRRLDAENVERDRQQAEWERANPEGGSEPGANL
ncbi:DUF4233 domain-containing protein [Arthrobacter sp. HLT1-21]